MIQASEYIKRHEAGAAGTQTQDREHGGEQ